MSYQPGLFDWPQPGLFDGLPGVGGGRYQVGQQVRYTHYLHPIDRRIEQIWTVKAYSRMRNTYLLERVDTGIPEGWAERLARTSLEDWQVSNYWAYWRAVFCGPMTTWALEESLQ